AFDNALGKVDTTDRVTLNTAELEFSGRGLRVIFNQVRQRLELLEIAEGEELRYARAPETAAKPKKPAKASASTSPPPSTQASASPVSPAGTPQTSPIDTARQPVETLYKVV